MVEIYHCKPCDFTTSFYSSWVEHNEKIHNQKDKQSLDHYQENKNSEGI